ncbi:MAG: STAS domain-containing protein [Cytophagales bacterium]|nr:STAS domain-containing protein [Cytophagales bacterium]
MLEISTSQERNYYIISLEGELDASTSLKLDTAIQDALQQNATKLVINLEKLQYVSSSGLGVFISYLSDFEAKGVYFSLLNAKDNILNTLTILGLEKLVPLIYQIPDE